jgi:hypothetical protein
MPRAVDKRPQARGVGNSLWNPNRSGVASWTDPMSAIDDAAQTAGTGIGMRIDDANAAAQQAIRDALTGIVNATPTDLDNWLLELLTESSDPWNALLTALFGGTTVGSTVQPAAVPDIDLSLSSASRDIVDCMNQVTGTGAGTGNPTTTVTDVFVSVWGAILTATQLAQEANSSNAASSVSGTVFSDSFGRIATGLGSGRYAITLTGISHAFPDGLRAAWSAGDTGTESDRTIVATQTDFQRVTLVLDNALAGPGAKNRCAGRCNTAKTSKVFVEVDRSNGLLGLYRLLSGTSTQLASAAYTPASGDVIDLDLGNPETLAVREFRVSVNGAPLIDWTTDTTSAYGPSNRFGEMVWIPSALGAPGLLRNFTLRDTAAPTYVGSGARICRTATGGVDVQNGVNPLPSNFFGSQVEATNDITIDLVAGTFKVRDADWYRLKAAIKTDANNWTAAVCLLLYRNTSPWLYGGTDHIRGISALSTAIVPRWIADEWECYLEADTVIGLGYNSNGFASGPLVGESTGFQTYFTITRGR